MIQLSVSLVQVDTNVLLEVPFHNNAQQDLFVFLEVLQVLVRQELTLEVKRLLPSLNVKHVGQVTIVLWIQQVQQQDFRHLVQKELIML